MVSAGNDRLGVMRPLVVIAGPTASGKSDVAQCVAERMGGVVLSADSMQVYRGMDIGTGKVAPEERRVAHYGLDLVDPGEPFSAGLYQEYARGIVRDLDAQGVPCVVCGGTGFYIRALVDDYRFPAGEQVGNEVRDRCMAYARAFGAEALWCRLQERDPESAALIPANDMKRVARAFEMLADGTSYAAQRESLQDIPQLLPAVFVGLSRDPARLRGRIDVRVDAMFSAGLVAEVQGLLDAGFRDAVTASQAIGYKEVARALDGECTMEEAACAIKTATHRYAKRQRTWFRKEARMHWLDADSLDVDALADAALALVARMGDGTQVECAEKMRRSS